MNKFDRVISTLVLLQTKKVIKASTISERFEISLRTVYRDISTLKNAGIPIIGDPGIGYSIMDGYRLPPIMFNEGEASALLTAEKFIGKLTDQDTQAYYTSAMMKIKAILRSSEKQSLEVFRKADGSISNRKLEPIGCYHQYNNWYLIAYCQLQKDYRTFKTNRIVNLQVLDQHFDKKHISLQDYIDQQDDSWKEQQQFYNIEISFKNKFVEFAEKRKYYFGFVEQTIEENTVTMKFVNSSIEIIGRWLLQFGNNAIVLAPKELKELLRTLSTQLHQHHR